MHLKISVSKSDFKVRICAMLGQIHESNLIKYNYSIRGIAPYTVKEIILTDTSTMRQQHSARKLLNPIIVYSTTTQDPFSGDIIHRLVAVLDVNGTYYTITKGDNNQASTPVRKLSRKAKQRDWVCCDAGALIRILQARPGRVRFREREGATQSSRTLRKLSTRR